MGNGKREREMASRWMDPKNQRENGEEEDVNGKMLNWAKQDITRKEKPVKNMGNKGNNKRSNESHRYETMM